jgi:hypothetical protein
VIADPLFYAIAIPAVLLVGISKTGFGGGLGIRLHWRDFDRRIMMTLPPGAALGAFTSFIAHAGGPSLSIYLLPLAA